MSNERVMQDKSLLKADDDIAATAKEIIATVREIKINRYSYMTLLFLLLISFSLNIGLFFLYHAQKVEYQQRESILVDDVAKWNEKSKKEYSGKFAEQNKQGEFAHCEMRDGKNGEQPYYICR